MLAKAGRQRASGEPVARHPEYGVDKEPVIDACSANIPGFARQMGGQSGPRMVTDFVQIVHERKDNCPYNLVQYTANWGMACVWGLPDSKY